MPIPNLLEKFVFNRDATAKRVTLAYSAELRIANPSNLLTVVYEIDVQPFINTQTDIIGTILSIQSSSATDLIIKLGEALARGVFQIEIRDDKNRQTFTRSFT